MQITDVVKGCNALELFLDKFSRRLHAVSHGAVSCALRNSNHRGRSEVATMQTVVIVGASLAGISSARALRSQGYAGALVVVGDESERPYDRPPLSKDFLSGKMSPADLSLEADQEDLGIQWRLGAAATGLDVHERIVTLGDGSRLPFDGAVLATGSRARTLPGTAGIPNVHTLRTLEDARRLREQLRAGGRLVVVGAGFVGAEVASTARSLGMDVTVIGADEVPLAGPLGAPMGALVGGLHRAHGVRLLCGTRVESLVVDDDGTGGGAPPRRPLGGRARGASRRRRRRYWRPGQYILAA